MAKQKQNYAIVIGIDTMQGLQTARILAGHNIPVIGIASNLRHHACRTNVCEKILQVDTNTESLIQTLTELGPTLTAKAVLYPCHDQSVSLISEHRDVLTAWYYVVLAAAEIIETLSKKDSFYEFVTKLGVAVPQSFVLRCEDDAYAAALQLKFPCVVKPVQRSPQWDAQTLSKAFQAADSEEFLAIYARVKDWAPELLAQQWIMGTDADLYSCNCYFDNQSNLVASFMARKLRQWPPRVGSSCLGEECRNDVVLNEAIRIFESISYVGLGYIEMKRDSRSGEYFVIEANVGRPTGRSSIAETGGVSILYAMYCDAVGLTRPADLEQKYLGVKWIDLRHDFQSALYYYRRGELTLLDWYKSLRGRKAYAVLSLRDPLPFFADLVNAIRVALSPRKRALRKQPSFLEPTTSTPASVVTSDESKL